MYIADEKRKTNIAEYLIYMFQVEDLIRSLQFDIQKIDEIVIQKYKLSYSEKRDIREWYVSIINHLKDSGNIKIGHCPFIDNLMNEVNDLHVRMLLKPEESKYHKLVSRAQSAIDELRVKAGSSDKHDVGICLEGLYGLFLLKLSRKEISKETQNAFMLISEMLSYLSLKFKEVDEGLAEI